MAKSIAHAPSIATQYARKGWIPLPLPAGAKFPPPSGVTGNRPSVDPYELWETAPANANIGLRMPSNVIALDVDDYDTKQGAVALAELKDELGDLPETYRCTRRGFDNPSGHRFYRVEDAIKWKDSAGTGIDVIQATHRYSVAYPSVVDGNVYRWFDAEGNECEIPRIEQLPELPKRWQDRLKRGSIESHLHSAPAEDYGLSEAMQWLESVAIGFDLPLSGSIEQVLSDGELAEELSGNAHGTMIARQHWLLRFCVLEGQTGLKAALDTLKELFVDAAKDRRSVGVLIHEFNSGLTAAVNKLRGAIEYGNKRPMKAVYAGMQRAGHLSTLEGVQAVADNFERAEQQIARALDKPAPQAVAGVIALRCGDWYALTAKGENSRLFDLGSRQLVTTEHLRETLNDVVSPAVAAYIHALGLDPEDDDEAEELKRLNGVIARVIRYTDTKDLSALIENICSALKNPAIGRMMQLNKLDATAHLVGIGDHVVDLEAVERLSATGLASCVDQWLRLATPDDAVTKSLELEPEAAQRALGELAERTAPTAAQRLFEAVWPDLEVRKFAQAALGYCLLGDNPLDKVFIFHGAGGTGKNSVMDTIAALLGKDYFSAIDLGTFKAGSASRPDPLYANSLQTRLTFVDETDDQTVDEAALKRATGNRTARNLYSNTTVASAGNTVVFATNHAFKFRRDSGTDRRLAVIPFHAHRATLNAFYAQVNDQRWRERDVERAWLLAWLLDGYAMAMSPSRPLDVDNYTAPIAAATTAFIDSADDTQEFYKRIQITDDPADEVSAAELVMHYRKILDPGHELKERAIQMEISKWFADQQYDMTNKLKRPHSRYRCARFADEEQSRPLSIVPPLHSADEA